MTPGPARGSRWAEAFPLRTQEATEVASVLYKEIFCRFGAPSCLVSDRGQNFLSKLIEALCELFHVTRHYTSSYHPQSNTSCERMNSTIAQTLRTYCDKDQMNWPYLIPSVMMAMRMSPNTESTGFSPFHMLFGKEMNIPIDIALKPKENLGASAKEHLEHLIEHLKIVQAVAKKNVKDSQNKTKVRYDKKAKLPNFAVGDQVMLQCMKIPKGFSPKLYAKWEGPFYITDVGVNNIYKLRRCLDHKILKSRIHANRLKHYNDPRNVREPPNPQNAHASQDIPGTQVPTDMTASQDTALDNANNDVQNQAEAPESNDDSDNQFLAENLLAKRKRNGKNYYRVKWVGYSKTSWVPEEDIGEGLLKAYYSSHTKSGKARKKKASHFSRQ